MSDFGLDCLKEFIQETTGKDIVDDILQFALDNDFESFKNNLAFSDESTAKEVMEIIKSNIK